MRRITVSAAAILIMLLGFSTVIGAPRLTIQESEFDFGFVPQNSKVSHEFWLYSTGDDSLKIVKVVPG